jgi:hypothetical protein
MLRALIVAIAGGFAVTGGVTAGDESAAAPCWDAHSQPCVVGGTATLSLAAASLEKIGVRVEPIAPAVRRDSQFVFPISSTDQYGNRSSWGDPGCSSGSGGSVYLQGGLAVSRAGTAPLFRMPHGRITLPPKGKGYITFTGSVNENLVLGAIPPSVKIVSKVRFHAETRVVDIYVLAGQQQQVMTRLSGSLALDVERSAEAVAALPPSSNCPTELPAPPKPRESLPSVKGGPLYPLLPGGVAYNRPVKDLFASFGRPRSDCAGQGFGWYCDWELGGDTVHWDWFPDPEGRTGDQVLLSALHLSSSPSQVAHSKLRSFHTPEGIHIGSSREAAMRAYEVTVPLRELSLPERQRTHLNTCGGGDILGLIPGYIAMTRPYAVTVGGKRTRQQYCILINWDGTGDKSYGCGIRFLFPPACKSKTLSLLSVSLLGQEGWCKVFPSISSRGRDLSLTADCFGPLVAARLEPADSTTQFTDETFRGIILDQGGTIDYLMDDAGHRVFNAVGTADPTYTVVPLYVERTNPRLIRWHVGCDVRFGTGECAPGRGSGPPGWPAGTFEHWHINTGLVANQDLRFHGGAPKEAGRIHPLRFTAEFLGFPPFTILIKYGF